MSYQFSAFGLRCNQMILLCCTFLLNFLKAEYLTENIFGISWILLCQNILHNLLSMQMNKEMHQTKSAELMKSLKCLKNGNKSLWRFHSSLVSIYSDTNLFIVHKGRTIHLLKRGSKSSMQERKRRKITVSETP